MALVTKSAKPPEGAEPPAPPEPEDWPPLPLEDPELWPPLPLDEAVELELAEPPPLPEEAPELPVSLPQAANDRAANAPAPAIAQ